MKKVSAKHIVLAFLFLALIALTSCASSRYGCPMQKSGPDGRTVGVY